MNLTIDEMRVIVDGAPSNAVIYWPIGSGKFGVYSAGEQNKSDRQIVLEDLRTAIAAYDCNPTDNLSHLTDNCTDIRNHDLSVSNPSQNDKQIDLSIKMDIEDNCTDIRNHISPNTKVIER